MQKAGLILLFCLSLVLGGCGDEVTNNYQTPPPGTGENTDTVTLQGAIMDAVTGQHLGGPDLKMWLIQGETIRNPSRLVTNVNDPLVGEYAFADIPVGQAANNKIYKVVAIKDNYQRFEGEISFAQVDGQTYRDFHYNKIGNIYLFPQGTATPNYAYTITFNGKPVPNATVLFQPVVTSNDPTTATGTNLPNGNVLPATSGYLQSLTAVSDADGKVVFRGADLALGAAYNLVVLPVVFEGVPLALVDSYNVVVGISQNTGTVVMSDLVPGDNPYGLYVKSISNAVDGQINTMGRLTIVFSRPVTVSGDFDAWNGNGGVLPTFVNHPVNVDLSADGLTLILSPNWETAPQATDKGAWIEYFNGSAFVSVRGYPASQFRLFGLVDASGSPISGEVQITRP